MRPGVARLDVDLPIRLGDAVRVNNRSPVEAFAGIANKLAYDRLEMQRFITRHQLTRVRMNPFFPVNTLKIMRMAVAAEELGCAPEYIDAVFSAMWEQARNMDDADEIAAALRGAGLDAAALWAKAQEPEVKARLAAHTQSAFDRGAFGSPTFFVGDDMFFGKDRLREFEEAIVNSSQ